MLHAFAPIVPLSTGDYLGAEAWLNVLASRSHWLYGQAHGLLHPVKQAWDSTTGAVTGWTGETTWRPEHPSLSLSCRVVVGDYPANAVLQVKETGGWTTLLTDTVAGEHWLGGSAVATFDLSSYDLADGLVTVRLLLSGGNTSGSSCTVYRARMGGTVGFPTWPTLPTFADGAGNKPSAAELAALVSAQEYLLACAKKSGTSVEIGRAYHMQAAAYEPLYRWSFVADGRMGLTCRLSATGVGTGAHVYLYLQDEQYPTVGTRLATLVDITSDVTDQQYDVDLSPYLVKQSFYCLELGTMQADVHVTVHNLVVRDLLATTRTYQPKSDWALGDEVSASQLNTIANDLNQMHPTNDRESPIWYGHELTSYLSPPQLALHGPAGPFYDSQGYRLVRRWRYLHYRGGGRIRTVDGLYEHALSDTTTPGDAQVLDLESLPLPYGMEYYVESYGTSAIIVAYEDYA